MVAYCAQTVLAGASVVFAVAIAFDLLDLGAAGLGYLDSTLGLGAVAGGFLAVGLATRKRLASDFGWGVVFWAVPLLLVAAWPTPVVVFPAMAIIGAANPVVDINASTIIQRLAPDAVLGRVFGALESGLIGTMALGSLVMPILVSTVGLRWGLVVLAVPIIALGLAAMPRLRRLDSTVSEPEGVALLAGVPLFAPLARPLLESLAGALTRVDVPAGTTVVTEGEVGDRFYVVAEGRLDAVHAGAVLSTMRQGECFGEIALLSDVPRTATVTATTDAVLYALDREEFLGACPATRGCGRAPSRWRPCGSRRPESRSAGGRGGTTCPVCSSGPRTSGCRPWARPRPVPCSRCRGGARRTAAWAAPGRSGSRTRWTSLWGSRRAGAPACSGRPSGTWASRRCSRWPRAWRWRRRWSGPWCTWCAHPSVAGRPG